MEDGWRQELIRLVRSARTSAEMDSLLRALLSPAEYDETIKRWQIFKLLIEGEPQRAISERLSVSIATVTRGARELKHGTHTLQKFYSRLYPKRR